MILWWVAFQEIGLDPSLQIRLFDAEIYLGPVVYVVLSFLVLAGASNGVNLTDGLDGLAAGCCAIVFLSYLAITITTGQEDLALLSACFVGASVGFLWFNSFPATIFMGDTGSLGLGGAIAGLAIMTQTEVLLIVLGGIFVIEALSVAIQVFTFKTFRRRVFLMAPLHHHFEMMAWSETKIMIRFWIIGAVLAGIGYTLFQNSIGYLSRAQAAWLGPRTPAIPRRPGGGGRRPNSVSAGGRRVPPPGRGHVTHRYVLTGGEASRVASEIPRPPLPDGPVPGRRAGPVGGRGGRGAGRARGARVRHRSREVLRMPAGLRALGVELDLDGDGLHLLDGVNCRDQEPGRSPGRTGDRRRAGARESP